MKHLPLHLAFLVASTPALGQDTAPREGWEIHPTGMPYTELVQAVKSAVKANGMAVVTEAGPTGAAASRGITIPGNRVIGAFNNDFAVRILALSTSAMIEAPVRFYVTENDNGTATLSYKKPSYVFAPYVDEGGATLTEIAAELDARFEAVATSVNE